MKKFVKSMFALVVAVLLVFSGANSFVLAQDENMDEVVNQLIEANKEVEPMSGNIKLDANVEGIASGVLNGDFNINFEPYAMDFTGNVDAKIVSADSEGNPTEMPLSMPIEARIVDGKLYMYDGYTWNTQDLGDFEAEIDKALAQQQGMNQDPELFKKYFDIVEGEEGYVATLKSDINTEEFWADIEASSGISLEEQRQQALDQMMEQLEAQAAESGEELTDEQKKEHEEQFNAAYDASMNMAFDLIDLLEVTYDKETYKVSKVVMNMVMTPESIKEIVASQGQEIPEENMAQIESLNFTLNFEFNVTETGVAKDIVAPEVDGASESGESAVEESAEDGSVEEESMEEESVEETTAA